MSANRARLEDCLVQAGDEGIPIDARLAALNIASQYLEAVTREMVSEAREAGQSWEDLADVFGSSAQNLKARFGSYREYGD